MTDAKPGKPLESMVELKTVTFEPGQVLFREHDVSYHFYIVQSGEIDIFKTNENGEEFRLTIVTSGASIGEFAMIDRQPRSASARAITTVTAVEVSEDAYKQLLSELPEWAVAVMQAMVERVRGTSQIISRPKTVTPAIRLEILSAEYETVVRKSDEHDPLDDVDTPDLG